MNAQLVIIFFGLVAAASCQFIGHSAFHPMMATVGHIPITSSAYASHVNHIMPIPAPIIQGVPQPYAVPVPQPFAVPRAVPVAVPRAVPMVVPRAVPVPMVAKAPTMYSSSIIDAGTKIVDTSPVAAVAMAHPWAPKMFW